MEFEKQGDRGCRHNGGGSVWKNIEHKGGTTPETTEISTHICSCHNFFPLSSLQILLTPACCLLCAL